MVWNIEYLLYGYSLVCLSMLVFNLVYTLHLRTGKPPAGKNRWRRLPNGWTPSLIISSRTSLFSSDI